MLVFEYNFSLLLQIFYLQIKYYLIENYLLNKLLYDL